MAILVSGIALARRKPPHKNLFNKKRNKFAKAMRSSPKVIVKSQEVSA